MATMAAHGPAPDGSSSNESAQNLPLWVRNVAACTSGVGVGRISLLIDLPNQIRQTKLMILQRLSYRPQPLDNAPV